MGCVDGLCWWVVLVGCINWDVLMGCGWVVLVGMF